MGEGSLTFKGEAVLVLWTGVAEAPTNVRLPATCTCIDTIVVNCCLGGNNQETGGREGGGDANFACVF